MLIDTKALTLRREEPAMNVRHAMPSKLSKMAGNGPVLLFVRNQQHHQGSLYIELRNATGISAYPHHPVYNPPEVPYWVITDMPDVTYRVQSGSFRGI